MSARERRAFRIVLATSIAAFVALAVVVFTWESADRRDVQFVNWVHSNAPEALVDSMRVLTHAGSVYVLGLLTLVAALLLMRHRHRAVAVLVLLTFVGSLFVDELLKAAFRRARPALEDPFVELTTHAFPSGHAFDATATYGALALAIALVAASSRARTSAAALAILLVILVAASRVVLGVHYLSDVLAGVAAGVALVAALVLLLRFRAPTAQNQALRRRRRIKLCASGRR